MQEEVENRTVNLAISTTKLTFRTIVNGYNAWKRHHQAKVAQKTAQLPVGKQSIKELIGQNQGVSSIPIEKTDLKGFEQVARKYGVDYAITKDQNVVPPKYTVFFKAKDFYSLLQPEDVEDLLALWLYDTKGYVCIPSTNKM